MQGHGLRQRIAPAPALLRRIAFNHLTLWPTTAHHAFGQGGGQSSAATYFNIPPQDAVRCTHYPRPLAHWVDLQVMSYNATDRQRGAAIASLTHKPLHI